MKRSMRTHGMILGRGVILTMIRIGRVGDGITIDGSALNIRRLALAGMKRALHRARMVAGQALRRPDPHRHLRSPSGPADQVVETARAGMDLHSAQM